MNQSYKIALIIAAALCVAALIYYVRQDNQAVDPPTVTLAPPQPSADPQLDQPAALPSPAAPQPDRPHPPEPAAWADAEPQPHQPVPTWTFDGQSTIHVELDMPVDSLGDRPLGDAQADGQTDVEMDEPPMPSDQAIALDSPDDDASAATGTAQETEAQQPQAPAPREAFTAPVAVDGPARRSNAPASEADTKAAPNADSPPSPEPASGSEQPRTYTIQPGDTFSGIAVRLYGDEAHWVRIAQANPTVDPARLKVGTPIRLPEADQPAPPNAPPGPQQVQSYVVKQGDSLIAIARQFYGDGSLWRVIYNHNRQTIGSDENRLQEGMRLAIPPRP